MRAPEFWHRDGALPVLLTPLGALYGLAGRLRAAAAQPFDPGVPVICVGNLVAGGAGKTPVVLALLDVLTRRGVAAHALTKGYGGRLSGPLRVEAARHDAAEVGDEAVLLARAAPTWLARDRVAGAGAAVAAGAEAIVMDDGFQDPSLVKRLSLLVVDGAYGFGNGRLIPAGPLREPRARGLARAGAVVILGEDTHDLARQLRPDIAILRARLAPGAEAPALSGRRVVAFAGIGRPEKFFASLEALGAQIVAAHAFADHHRFRRAEIEDLLARAEAADAIAITTEKDQVRLPAELRAKVATLPVAVAWRDPQAIEALLAKVIGTNDTESGAVPARRHGAA